MKTILGLAVALALLPAAARADVQTGAEYLAELRQVFGPGEAKQKIKAVAIAPMIGGIVAGLQYQRTCFVGMSADQRAALKGFQPMLAGYGEWLDRHPDDQRRPYPDSLMPFLLEFMRCT